MTDPVFALEPDIPRNVRIARWLLFRLLSGIREGSLTVREGAQTFHFGDPAAALRAEARVLSADVYWRLLTGGSLAAAEAWMDGDWESQQLTQLLQILARNGQVLGRLERGFRLLGKPVARLRHWTRRNSRAQARENIAAHYDLGNDFYAHFLDDELLYSSALFTDDGQDLTQAQRAKMARLCDRLALTPGDRLLEIGTGWGRWPNTPPATTAAGSPPPPCHRNSSSGPKRELPAPGWRIASRCCSAITAISPASTTSCCRWR
jgi:cyclopropane-fatty-acyl-phospholipid synthase